MKGFRSMKKRVESLNLVRVGLIFTIFLCHSGDMLPDVIGYYAGTLTGYALQLFFMISGFCCLLSGYGKDLSTGPYMKKRWWKIFPHALRGISSHGLPHHLQGMGGRLRH